jgi:hypothetical protein
MTGVFSAPCSGKTDSTYVVIEGKAIAKCGIRVLLPAEPITIRLSRSGQIICQGMVQVDSEMEQSCGCRASPEAQKPALSEVVCQSEADK